jgi:hypothetical protein
MGVKFHGNANQNRSDDDPFKVVALWKNQKLTFYAFSRFIYKYTKTKPEVDIKFNLTSYLIDKYQFNTFYIILITFLLFVKSQSRRLN